MRLTISVLALCGVFGLAGPALAQSVGAPAGSDPATAPGGTEGRAGPRNEREAIRSGDAIPAPPGIGEPILPPSGIPTPDRPPAPRP
ncbi:hypothetical protein ASG60_16115 [Methylobacterium sp. Leaf469]|jgi:hypothetical protein|uniref:hypothetical protein n=1 Tax=unclassified Methylobacterium TaxID=2615210 RepID=UPI0006F59996|nr:MULTISPECIES: hypothetical protein [unclassified Methylobacterium]USU31647.1 hypothetical protein NG677_20430 [Methylobacterium sp. OTU13CASTA1]KQP33133.1 hypothetical protein ASF27_16490 [Methylobacterium sp. Leaf102]KQP34890.1 hypothetical protein ASF25_15180 [Methylobacterium sp. Leaf100]KQP68831.1 hypothetical protein ASF52_16815 [Methylobacterium sp. Leaf112]KQU04880.1 hypothetical protein ASG60_16115 [Methylobacterium sp. Leaf469]